MISTRRPGHATLVTHDLARASDNRHSNAPNVSMAPVNSDTPGAGLILIGDRDIQSAGRLMHCG